ncbi:MAG TPA: carbon starvation protein A [Marinilabiliales bacterium]|nr:MAG: carbon starvation protein CstA [Bacteroidetes bacterium GWA2_40_14]OFX62502.1 MAG: carbon starvation protein CstA [Bacteroidetes bacterium GWC2_40_13]OFX74006.1 MAG: carbon starvation protein CstA [Bacteroidetes bacterium GWD2_40_43]OFX93159.1 MAG: carbon starvation protein CstA [Bacteroidetes bacterium GWE2_40_63]OFY21529.1 MAG: carbon starvation protein CstA [Bacteroidetes bacterium GWF2_40_13]OFZ24182.1 MAG: carbon starvation protein CstA [Bacteroidetes bacterium RIFOXYC2_FULL_40_12
MVTFLLSIGVLITGYFIYGKFIGRFFGASNTIETPVLRLADGVDYIPMKPWRMFMIQFLNIAGLGPIFGAILGAMYGPWAYVWIVLGNIFMGAVHDYFSGMISVRNHGASLPELVGKYLGNGARQILRIFTLLLLIMVGVAFVNGPAKLLDNYTGIPFDFWLYLIFIYYLLATLLPINQIIGRIYPFFGAALLFMACAVGGYMLWNGFGGSFDMNEISFSELKNMHVNPDKNILFPMMFIVISCGAISGFHSTQSPMMARCMAKESQGRSIFYGAMVAEGIVAIIWATAAMNYFGSTEKLNEMVATGHDPAWIVKEICQTWFGKVGAALTIIGVIAAPITTGDTAFRSARLTIADMFRIKQGSMANRLWISVPMFVLAYVLTQIEFSTIWKFLGLFNQFLSVIVLWMGAVYLLQIKKFHWLLSVPATFMTAVTVTYLLVAPTSDGGLSLSTTMGYSIGAISALGALLFFLSKSEKTSSPT